MENVILYPCQDDLITGLVRILRIRTSPVIKSIGPWFKSINKITF